MFLSEEDKELAEELARRAAIAIDNARLFEQLTKSNEELEKQVAKRTEELSKAITELKRSNQELDDFAKVASHDLQEPLRKINTFSTLLQNKYLSKSDDKSQEYIERIVTSTERMRGLIEGLLTYSRVSSKEQRFDDVDLNKIINSVLSDLEVAISESNSEIEVEEIPVIEADSLQMNQVFQNLISNAIKFRKKGTPPKIRIFADDSEDSLVKIYVEDNGIGIRKEHIKKIFTVFERLHSKTQYKGTGIGLAVVHKIIERHGGKIEVESKPGKGTTFIITLPKFQDYFDSKAVNSSLMV